MLLPKEGNYLALKTANDVREKVTLTDADQDAIELNVNQETGALQWNPQKAKEVELDAELTPRAVVMIEDALKKLEKDQKLTNDHISLYEKFVESKETE